VLSSAVEDGLITMNPAFRLGRFMESQKREHEAQAMEPGEVERFLADAKQNGPIEYYVLFLIALRAGPEAGRDPRLTLGRLPIRRERVRLESLHLGAA
jgi:hypothetical protein